MMASTEPLRISLPSRFTPDMRVCAVKGTNTASCEARSRPRRLYCSFASTTIERPSGVSSAREKSGGQPRKQNFEHNLVRSLLPLGALDQSDHSVEEGFAWIRSDADFNHVGEPARAAGNRRPVSSGFADDGRGLPGDRRLVHRS